MGQIIVLGMNPSGKVPAALFNVNAGKGRVSVGQIPVYLLLVGMKTSGGSLSPDTEVVDVYPSTDVGALVGNRSELAQMIRAAQGVPGVRLKVAAVTEPSGGTQATATITLATAASSDGTHIFYLAGEQIRCDVSSGDSASAQASALVTAINDNPYLPASASAVEAVVTVTCAQKGTRGNDWTLYHDPSEAPSGTTVALASASAYSVSDGPGGVTGVRLGGGTGSDDVTDLLTVLGGDEYFTIAAAQNDTTNAARWLDYDQAKAAIGTQVYEHIVFGQNGLYATAQTLSKSTLNDHRHQVAWARGSEDHPAVIAAVVAALRTQAEQVHPNSRLNGAVCTGLHPQRAAVDRPTGGETGEQQTALDNGVTPLCTRSDGRVVIVRSITTLCLRNSVPFYGCIDSGQARTPDMAARELQLAWDTEYSESNPWVDSDPAANEKARPERVATPSGWRAYAQELLAKRISQNWFSSVDVAAEYDADNKMILTEINLEVTPQNHRVGGNVNQVI